MPRRVSLSRLTPPSLRPQLHIPRPRPPLLYPLRLPFYPAPQQPFPLPPLSLPRLRRNQLPTSPSRLPIPSPPTGPRSSFMETSSETSAPLLSSRPTQIESGRPSSAVASSRTRPTRVRRMSGSNKGTGTREQNSLNDSFNRNRSSSRRRQSEEASSSRGLSREKARRRGWCRRRISSRHWRPSTGSPMSSLALVHLLSLSSRMSRIFPPRLPLSHRLPPYLTPKPSPPPLPLSLDSHCLGPRRVLRRRR